MPSIIPAADAIEAVASLGGKLIERIFPDKTAQAADRERAALELARLQQDGTIKETATQLSAIIAEAQSSDPYTSRARPSFLYVMYAMILFALPMGVLSAFRPDLAQAIAVGMKAWLAAIPDSLYTLFGVGYLGYTGARTFDKIKGAR